MTNAASTRRPFGAAKDVILSFARLPVGWHYGTGGPISQAIIERALEIDRKLARFGMRTTAFPGEDGGILLCGYAGDDSVELRLNTSGHSSLIYERAQEEIFYEEGLSDASAAHKVEALIAGSCATSVLPTQNTMISRKAASALKLFAAHLPNGAVELRSSPAIALMKAGRASASISSTSIAHQYLVTQQYSLSSQKQSYQRVTA